MKITMNKFVDEHEDVWNIELVSEDGKHMLLIRRSAPVKPNVMRWINALDLAKYTHLE